MQRYNLSMSKTKVESSQAPQPIGPYSQAVKCGNLLFLSGQTATSPVTQHVVEGGVVEQTRQVFENLKAVLEAGGSGLDRVVKSTVFLKNMNDFSAMNQVYAQYLGAAGAVAPARSTVEVARLPKDVLVEIELIAEI
jgi:2-iminobutanoate/2-iminopropanoate deaminase